MEINRPTAFSTNCPVRTGKNRALLSCTGDPRSDLPSCLSVTFLGRRRVLVLIVSTYQSAAIGRWLGAIMGATRFDAAAGGLTPYFGSPSIMDNLETLET